MANASLETRDARHMHCNERTDRTLQRSVAARKSSVSCAMLRHCPLAVRAPSSGRPGLELSSQTLQNLEKVIPTIWMVNLTCRDAGHIFGAF